MKRTFKYCKTHLDDEAYMRKMCAKGYGAIKLVEGFWTFEECKANEYCYRVCYLRGKTKSKIEELKKDYASKGIEFVSRYSFWAILRSKKEFSIYNQEEELEICKKIYQPMPIGVVLSLIVTIILFVLAFQVNLLFIILAFLTLIYFIICTYLAYFYHELINNLKKDL